jgi:uncharacterized membrane protein YphA (DoxX/SURF4 family)
MLVILRVVLGWHFLYEGVWKIKNPEKFAVEAEGFLTGARGPMGPMFHAMVPDLDGRQRLQSHVTVTKEKDGAGKEVVKEAKNEVIEQRWETLRQKFVDYYNPGPRDETLEVMHDTLADKAQKVYARHVAGLQEYLTEKADDVAAYFAALDRFQEGKKKDPKTSFQKQRRWDEMQQLRREAKQWLTELDDREKAFQADLLALVEKPAALDLPQDAPKDAAKPETEAAPKAAAPKAEKKADAKAAKKTAKAKDSSAEKKAEPKVDLSQLAEKRGGSGPFAPSMNPFQWKRMEQIAFALTWGLFGLGLCLMLGIFTRPAALGGGIFMLFVVLSQPSFPGVYPPDPPQLGHALLVNKDFVEMISLLLVATTAVGSWCGLDWFLYHCVINPFLSKTVNRQK